MKKGRKQGAMLPVLFAIFLAACVFAGCNGEQEKEPIIPPSFLEECSVSVYNLGCAEIFDRIPVTDQNFAKEVVELCNRATIHRDLVLPRDLILGGTLSALCNLEKDSIRYEIDLIMEQLDLSGAYRDKPVFSIAKYVRRETQDWKTEWGRYYILSAQDYAMLFNLIQSITPDGSRSPAKDPGGRYFWEKELESNKLYVINTELDPGTSRRTVPDEEMKSQVLSLVKKAEPFRPVTETDPVWSPENDKDFVAAELESMAGDIKVRISMDDWKTQLSMDYRYRETPVVKIVRFDEGSETSEAWYYVMQTEDYAKLLNLLSVYTGGICQ